MQAWLIYNERPETPKTIATGDGRYSYQLPHYVHELPEGLALPDSVVIEDIVTGDPPNINMAVATYRYPRNRPRAHASVERYAQEGRLMWKVRVEAKSFDDAKKLFDLIMYGDSEPYVYQTFVGNARDAGLRLEPSTLRQVKALLDQIDNPHRQFRYIQEDLGGLRELLDLNL